MKKKLIVNMRSFVDKIWCVPLPLFIATPPPAYQLSVVFSPLHPTPAFPLSIMHFRVFYRGGSFAEK